VIGLFGLTQPPQLVQINVATGSVTNIGQPIAAEGMAQELSTIDDKGAVFYFIGHYDAPNLCFIFVQ
jgi:hypothetical protein